jgi:formylglycine-generating enzyme required for sulfatase activity
MAGNVNEWVQDTYRQTSFEEVDDFNPFRGNQFTNKELSDPSKGLYAKDKYGRPIRVPATSDRKLKYADYLAQLQSDSLKKAATAANPKSALAGKPYNPDARGFLDTVNNSLYGTTTLVNDRSKVYKGGSWNDLAFWLNPATRRFMDEGDASAEVGFRCAMDLVGSDEIHPEGKPHFSVKKAKPFKVR